ncbi:MAG: FadR family transcriptional regulator [Candidatus Eremiobacteraeota bacterium]|nr:FadR family transcriptional regulator [Candidatus Eremiobacteraeota bacterium]
MVRSNQSAKSTATPVRPQRAFEDVILQIRQAIVERRLAVGDRLPHARELAERFGVSRQSVREALRMLEAFGVLSARRGAGPESGWTVSADGTTGLSVLLDLYTSLQRIPIWDLLEIREALEMLSVRSAAAHATPEDTAELLAAARAMADATTPEAFLEVDTEFHVSIARRSGNSLAPLFMEAIRDAMSRVMLAAFQALPDWASERELLVREHVDLASKIGRQDGDSAATAVSEHIRGFYGRALKENSSATESAIAGSTPASDVSFLRRRPVANASPRRP